MQLQGAADKLREEIGGGPPRDKTFPPDPVGDAREAIGEAAVARALDEGRQLGVDAAFELAFGRGNGLPAA